MTNAHISITQAPAFEVIDLSVDFQNAYSIYRNVVEGLIDTDAETRAMGEQCQEHIASGSVSVVFGQDFLNSTRTAVAMLHDRELSGAIRTLGGD